jgi:hypothetical protein
MIWHRAGFFAEHVLPMTNHATVVLLKRKSKEEKVNGVVKSGLVATTQRRLIFVLNAQNLPAISLKINCSTRI